MKPYIGLAVALAMSAPFLAHAEEEEEAPLPPITISEVAADETYGYTEGNPIKVGGGPARERAYLSLLRGPNGEAVRYEREGSCCPFETPNGILGEGHGLLDRYSVQIGSVAKPVTLYLNMYDYEQPKAPRVSASSVRCG